MQKGGRNKLILGSTAYPSLETQTRTPEAAFSPSVPLGFGVSLGHLGCGRACPGSLARSEVTSSCVETTPVKRHGNGRGCHPHRAQAGRVPGAPGPGPSAETQERREGRVGALRPLGAASGRGQWPMAVDSGVCT